MKFIEIQEDIREKLEISFKLRKYIVCFDNIICFAQAYKINFALFIS